MNKHLLYRFSALTLFFAGVLLTYVYFLLFVPLTVIQPFTQPYLVLTRVVHPGGTLTYLPQYCKYVASPASSERAFASALVYAVPPVYSNLPAGCHKEAITVRVPANLPPGTYHLQLDITYHINVLRNDTYHFTTQSFRVTN